MKPTQQLHELGQSLWLDNITRDMLGDGTLRRYIDELSITGLTSNPTIFDKAISGWRRLRRADHRAHRAGPRARAGLFFELALRGPPRRGANCSSRVNERTDGVDGWVSLEVSPLLADDAKATIAQVAELHARARGTTSSSRSPAPTRDARRSRSRSSPASRSTSRCSSRPSSTSAPPRRTCAASSAGSRRARPGRALGGLDLRQPLGRGGRRRGPAGAAQPPRHRGRQARLSRLSRAARLRALAAPRQRGRPAAAPALREHRHQGSRTPPTPSTSRRSRRPFTINTMPDKTLLAFADHGEVGDPIPPDGGDAEQVLGRVRGRGRRRRRARRPASARGRGGVRQVAGTTSCSRSKTKSRRARGHRVSRAEISPSPPHPRKEPTQCNSE